MRDPSMKAIPTGYDRHGISKRNRINPLVLIGGDLGLIPRFTIQKFYLLDRESEIKLPIKTMVVRNACLY